MEKKYEVKINPTPLSSDEIAQHRDFDALMKAYEANPAPELAPVRSLWPYWSAAAAMALLLIGALLYLSDKSNGPSYEIEAEAHFASMPFVNPPLPEILPEFQIFQLNANDGGIYEYESGSRLVVPSAAFETASGQLVEGEVQIRYREMHNFVDFYLAGIPMRYDSANVQYTLESAGMVEVYAEQNGQPLRMRPEKSIEVELVSEITTNSFEAPSGYNIYQLDTSARNWVYSDVDRIQLVSSTPIMPDAEDPMYEELLRVKEQLDEIDSGQQAALSRLEQSLPKPTRPQLHQPDQFVFDFDIEDLAQALPGDATAEQLSKLRTQYAGTMWQLAPGSDATPESLQNAWEDMKLKPLSEFAFELTLIAPDEQVKVVIQPVLSGSKYEAAIASYQEANSRRELELERERNNLQQQGETKRRTLLETLEQSLRQQPANLASMEVRHKIVNRFEAKSLGIWNCDRPVLPAYQTALASFDANDQKTLDGLVVFLADRNRNTVTRFLATEATPIRFLSEGDNILWAQQPNGQLAVIRPEAFREFARNARHEEAQALMLEPIADRPRSKADLNKALLE